MSKNKKRFIIGIISIFVLGCLIFLIYRFRSSNQLFIDPEKIYQLYSVLDGDTIRVKIEEKIITVRMLGIDTPETVDPRREVGCFGPEASKETKQLLSGHQIILKLNPKREVTDKYGRYLAYVYREDGLFINEYLIEKGYAKEYTYGSPYSFQKEFKALEKEAQKSKIGLWGECI